MAPRRQSRTARELFAANMKCRRAQAGLTQEALAAASGLHRTYIGSVERGERNISIDNMEIIARALGCRVRDLLEGEANHAS